MQLKLISHMYDDQVLINKFKVEVYLERIGPPTPLKLLMLMLTTPWHKVHYLILGPKLKFLNLNELKKELVLGKSLVRWGDGETAIARGKSISYQSASSNLQLILKNILKKTDNNTVYGISWAYNSRIWDKRWNKKSVKVLLSTRIFWCANFNPSKNSNYVETTIFYDLGNKFPIFLNEISKNKSILLLASDKNYLKVCPSRTKYVECRPKDSFHDFERIISEIDGWKKSAYDKRLIVFCALGPTTKAIWSHYIGQKRIQVVDIGHGFSFYLNGENGFAWNSNKIDTK